MAKRGRGPHAAGALFAAGAALAALLATSASAGSAGDGARFPRIPEAANYAKFTPALLRGDDRPVRVILKLTGDPVAKRDAAAKEQGTPLSKSEKDAIRAELKRRQKSLAAQVQSLGGEVTADYQDAYNGVAARIRLSKLPSLASLEGVAAVHVARIFEPDNTNTVPYIGGDTAWNDTGVTGDGVKVAIIDTGVDYFHANFGGSGNPADFASDNGTIIEPGSFPTAKVVGGTDFVGDAYDASSGNPAVNTPNPDPDPKDCNGHGSHVAGTAAGFGVLSTGATYGGPYNASTLSSNTFRIGPGVAPKAKILAYRVFGCDGSASEEVIVAAINRAVEDGADVINMSLGSPFGRADEPSAEAADAAAEDGVVVVASAGNEGPNAYVTGSPAAADRALSVAALDAVAAIPVASLKLSTDGTITVQNSNNAALPGGPLPVAVLRTSYPSGPVALGCDASDYANYPGGVTGKLVVTLRGVCARVLRAELGEAAGAAAVAMINTSNAFPPFEGAIPGVSIPFLGVKGAASPDDDNLIAADGGSGTLAALAPIANPGFKKLAPFSSGGPRNVDSGLKPEVTAPGVSVASTAVGTGNGAATLSGTSMSSPATAGVAALVKEAHPSWSAGQVKAAIINTADPSSAKILSYDLRTAGAGVVQAQKAANTVGLITAGGGKGTIDFGYVPLTGAYTETKRITLQNTSHSPITYNLAASLDGSVPAGTAIGVAPASITVAAGDREIAHVTLSLSAAAVAALADASSFTLGPGALETIRGAVTATPTSGGVGIYPLRMPVMAVPRGLSKVVAGPRSAYTTGPGDLRTATLPLTNSGIHRGTADLYAWGIHDANDVVGAEDGMDVRDAGVQAFDIGGGDRFLVFAVNNYGRSSNASVNEIDIAIDTKKGPEPDFFVVGVDLGAVLTGSFDGRYASFTFAADGTLVDAFFADAPMNGSTVLLPALASDLGLNAGAKKAAKFTYFVASFSLVPGSLVDITGAGSFRLDKAPVSTGDFTTLDPGGSTTWTLTANKGRRAAETQLGWLVVTLDDANGEAQADEVPLGALP